MEQLYGLNEGYVQTHIVPDLVVIGAVLLIFATYIGCIALAKWLVRKFDTHNSETPKVEA